jgi:feruloyl esterase
MARHFVSRPATILLATCVVLPATAATICEQLTGLTLPNATITTAQYVPAGSFTPPGSTALPNLPAFCRVAGFSSPNPDSRIGFEVWMPANQANWNSRYQQSGNGGFAGVIPYASLAAGLRAGYAIAGTDDGHTGIDGSVLDGSWAVGHHPKVVDFGFRALKETTDKAKAVIAAFYGTAPTRSYFVGCSDGGREALMEAQRFPEDFDGIVAAAPANFWSHHFTGFIWNEQALLGEGAITPAKLTLIQSAALAKCDELDGVKDAVVTDPRDCNFDPATLQCSGADSPGCLTAAQVASVKKILSGPRNPRTGERIYLGYEPSAAAVAGAWGTWITGTGSGTGSDTVQALFGNGYFADMVFEDLAWNFRSLNFDADVAFADATTAGIFNSNSPDLSRFKAHGGKLIQWHGWEDPAIAPRDSIRYYESVVAQQANAPNGRGENALRDTQDFYRLFMAPGVLHCGGGPGPNTFDVLGPLVKWVEQGTAPEQIVATKFNGDNPANGIATTRPLCTYPAVATYKGKGDANDAASFDCKGNRRGTGD